MRWLLLEGLVKIAFLGQFKGCFCLREVRRKARVLS